MFCKHCGKEIDDNAFACVHCGVATGAKMSAPAPVKDKNTAFGIGVGSFILSMISLLFGVITLIPAIGLSVGMISVSKTRKGNAFGIIGVVVNALVLLGWVIFFCTGILSIAVW